MIQLNFIREHRQEVIERLGKKYFDGHQIISAILDLDDQRRQTQKLLDEINSKSNLLAKEIGILFQSGKVSGTIPLKEQSAALKAEAKDLESRQDQIKKSLDDLLVTIPNLPHHSVPFGRHADDNQEIIREGTPPELTESALPHWDLCQRYNIIDFALGTKITGAGFPVYKGKGARLQRALINFFLDQAREAGYEEVQPPYLINAASGFGTGQLPDKDGQMYYVGEDELFLIPTAEVPVTNLYRDQIIEAGSLPVRNAAYSACFRREAGSYGKDVRGLNRLHQFDKVEIVQVTFPEKSYQALEEMREYVTGLLRKLELPFRVLKLCGGDLSFTSALTYDMEVFSTAQKRWLEVSSVSNFEDFQANRMKLRFRDTSGKIRLAHTLNGSALALPRIVAALLENNQFSNGIRIPGALIPYTGFDQIS